MEERQARREAETDGPIAPSSPPRDAGASRSQAARLAGDASCSVDAAGVVELLQQDQSEAALLSGLGAVAAAAARGGHAALLAAGAAPKLVQCARSNDAGVLAAAALALREVAAACAREQGARARHPQLVMAGAVPALCRLLKPPCPALARTDALAALQALALGAPGVVARALASTRAVPALLAALRDGGQEQAQRGVLRLLGAVMGDAACAEAAAQAGAARAAGELLAAGGGAVAREASELLLLLGQRPATSASLLQGPATVQQLAAHVGSGLPGADAAARALAELQAAGHGAALVQAGAVPGLMAALDVLVDRLRQAAAMAAEAAAAAGAAAAACDAPAPGPGPAPAPAGQASAPAHLPGGPSLLALEVLAKPPACGAALIEGGLLPRLAALLRLPLPPESDPHRQAALRLLQLLSDAHGAALQAAGLLPLPPRVQCAE
jgi:hypothetical protein